jgi:hypothetical protein
MARTEYKSVSVYRGVDSGGGCPCVTPPTKLSPPVGNVFVEKVAAMGNGDVLTPAVGTTCDPFPSVCSRSRVVRAANFTFVNGVSISTIGDILNPVTAIRIPRGALTVFA